jgi:hypothetical protein
LPITGTPVKSFSNGNCRKNLSQYTQQKGDSQLHFNVVTQSTSFLLDDKKMELCVSTIAKNTALDLMKSK